MRTLSRWLWLIALFVWAPTVYAALNVFATVPEWGALLTELGGDKVNVYVATTALQDPHRIEAKPSLIARARGADLVVATGAELEIGWLPLVTQQAGNAKIQPGKPGYFEAAALVTLVDKPARLDRADGDVHAAGDPHIQMDPRNIARIAPALATRLADLDPANAGFYQERYRAFDERLRTAIGRWEREAAPLRGVAIVAHHKGFTYLERWLGIDEVATLEPVPGLEPTSGHLSRILAAIERKPVKMVIRATHQSDRASQWIADRAKIKSVALPTTIGGTPAAKDLFTFYDDLIGRLLAAVQ
jgi:zinc/manganese transport system substrate-binding protein